MKDKKEWLTGLYALFILLNMVLSPSQGVVNVYALIMGLIIIYGIKWEKASELLYYFVLLLSVLDFAFNLPVAGRLNIYYLHIATFILTLSMARSFMKRRPLPKLRDIYSNKYVLFLTIFIAYMLISVAWAENRSMALKYVVNYGVMICFMLAVYTYNPNLDKTKETLKVLLYTTIPVLIIGTFEMLAIRTPIRNVFSDNGLYEKAHYLQTIPTVFFYNPNNYGVFLVIVMAFVLPFIAYKRTVRQTRLFWVLQLVVLLNLIFCTSRTAYIVMLLTVLGFILFFMGTREWFKFRRTVVVGMMTLIIFYGLSFVPSLSIYYGKFNDTPIVNMLSINRKVVANVQPIAEYGEDGSTSERWTTMIDIINGVFKEGHLQGFGVNNTATYLKEVGNTHGIVNPHSLWFEVLGDFGVGIFLYFIIIYLNLLWDLLKVYRESIKNGAYGLTSYLAVSLFGALGGFILSAFAPSSVISFPQMWLLYGLAASLIVRRREFIGKAGQQD